MCVSYKRVVAVIQARMGSSRLPGKMMAPLAGQPLLFHIVERARCVRRADEIVLATTDRPGDDTLARQAKAYGIRVIRGSEEDVLQRFLLAAQMTQAHLVVRICGDAPLFDPEFLDRSVSLLLEQDADVVVVENASGTAWQGASVLSTRALNVSRSVAGADPLAREHVTAYVERNAVSMGLRIVSLVTPPELLGRYRLSIDTSEDLECMRALYRDLYVPGRIVSLREAVAWFRVRDSH